MCKTPPQDVSNMIILKFLPVFGSIHIWSSDFERVKKLNNILTNLYFYQNGKLKKYTYHIKISEIYTGEMGHQYKYVLLTTETASS